MENTFVIGHPSQVLDCIGKMVGFPLHWLTLPEGGVWHIEEADVDRMGAIPLHWTISREGMARAIKEARETGKALLVERIDGFLTDCVEILVGELKKGGFKCIAYSFACPCDSNVLRVDNHLRGHCNISQSKRDGYYARIRGMGLASAFKVMNLSDLGMA